MAENRLIVVGVPTAALFAILTGVAISFHHSLANSNVGPSTAAYSCILGGAFLMIAMAFFLWWIPTSMWKNDPHIGAVQRIEFTNAGLDVGAGSSTLHRPWTLFRSSYESGHAYTLSLLSSNALIIIPKRSIESRSDEIVFREMLQLHTHARLRNMRGGSA